MKRIWKIVLVIAVFLIAVGILAAAIGWFTGASPARMTELIFGSREALEEQLESICGQAAQFGKNIAAEAAYFWNEASRFFAF